LESELVLVLILAILVLALGIWHSSGKKDRGYKSTPRHNNATANLQPFDAKNARPIPDNIVLFGLAYVVDGDSIVIQKNQIRLFGVDAPEINHPFGQKAKWALVSLCKGQRIRAEAIEQDDHGRIVARCYLEDGRDLSAEMVKLGLAIDWPKFSAGEYRALEVSGIRKKLWLADARQKGRIHVWQQFEAKQRNRSNKH